MTTDLQDAMWKNKPDRIAKAKEEALVALKVGNTASYHSIMLSAYYTALGGKPTEGRHTAKFFVLALYHALCMYWRWEELSHNQLDVLVQFLIRLRKKLPFFPFRPDLTKLAKREVDLVLGNPDAKPHQKALGYMAGAEVEAMLFGASENFFYLQHMALKLEAQIRKEEDQPQGLRQLVRVWKKAGEVRLSLGHKPAAMDFFRKALELAEGEADALDQVEKIKLLLPYETN